MSIKLTNSNWPTFATTVAAPVKPDEYSPAALARLMEYLEPYIVEVKNLHFKFHARNSVKLIQFSTPDEREAYEKTEERYLKSLAEIEGDPDIVNKHIYELALFTIYRKSAELIRAPYLAREMWHIVNSKQKAAVCAVSFKGTISKIVSILVNDYNVKRDEISLIWGGEINKPDKKQRTSKRKAKGLSKAVAEKLRKHLDLFDDGDIEFLRELGIETDIDIASKLITPEEEFQQNAQRSERELLRLGTQNKNQRQIEIDRFQSGKSKYCLFTFKSGGVGLSLHHDTEGPEHRPREVLLAPTYSAIELVQGLGRSHRITSISDTIQTIVFYDGTIENHVAARVSTKLRCLKSVVKTRESWQDVIIHPDKNDDELEKVSNEEVIGDEINNIESEEDEE